MDAIGQATAFGAGMAGGHFDPVAFVRRPSVLLKTISAVSLHSFSPSFSLFKISMKIFVFLIGS